MNQNLAIEIQYKIHNSPDWHSLDLTPEQYFDLEDNEPIEIDCIPRYNHAIDYLKDLNLWQKKTIIVTRINLIDFSKKEQRQITERFWNQGKNRIIERIDLDLGTFHTKYNEILIETQIKENPSQWQIMRLNRQDGIISPIFHGLIEENSDGSESENLFIIEAINKADNLTEKLLLN
jgi:hypothetical protein